MANTLTLEQAAAMLFTCTETVSECIRSRGLPAAKIGRAWVLVDEDVVNWLLTGNGPKLLRDLNLVQQATTKYQVLNLKTMAMVVAAVDNLLPGGSSERRAGLIAMAYEYMNANESTSAELLAEYLRTWAKTNTSEPAPIDFNSPEVREDAKIERSGADRRRLPVPAGDDDHPTRAARARKNAK